MKIYSIAALVFLLLSFGHPSSGDLIIDVENIKSEKGMIWIALYDSEEHLFVKEKAILKGVKIEKKGVVRVQMKDVEFGTYALAVFHDVDNNGELDQNWFGIPTEPYGFVRKPKSKWRAPRYEELSFDLKKTNQSVRVKLETWWD